MTYETWLEKQEMQGGWIFLAFFWLPESAGVIPRRDDLEKYAGSRDFTTMNSSLGVGYVDTSKDTHATRRAADKSALLLPEALWFFYFLLRRNRRDAAATPERTKEEGSGTTAISLMRTEKSEVLAKIRNWTRLVNSGIGCPSTILTNGYSIMPLAAIGTKTPCRPLNRTASIPLPVKSEKSIVKAEKPKRLTFPKELL